MRKMMNISVPEDMYEFILESTRQKRFGSVSEYIRSLVRQDRLEQIAQTEVPQENWEIRPINECLAGFKGR